MSDMMTIEKFMREFTDGKSESDIESSVRWLNSYRQEWMSEDQWLLSLFLCRVFRGFHHCPEIKQRNCGVNNIVVNTRTSYFANYDYDMLTKMVIMSHNWGVRVGVSGGSPGMLKISLWKRHKREGDVSERLPTIDHMVDKYRDF